MNYWQELINKIASQTGIRIRPQDLPSFQQKIQQRIKTVGLLDEQEYLDFLSKPSSQKEWDQIAVLITTGESYFLRDRGQINLLREHILPALYQLKQPEKKLTILSAGCATGEEVYSLSILLREITCDFRAWQINVIGLDLNSESIQKAKRGIYPDWSFRGVENYYRATYFRKHLEGWEVLPFLKQGVKFYQANLVTDDISQFTGGTVDLILCRNVFIYFDSWQIQKVLTKFIQALSLGGYLITGHTELQGQEIYPLEMLSYPESVVYYLPKNHNFILPVVNQEENKNTSRREALLDLAYSYMETQQYSACEQVCHQILTADHTCLEALALIAQIAEVQGNYEQAKDYLRRMLFLDPNHIPPYFALIQLHLADQEHAQAQQLIQTLESLAEKLSPTWQLQLDLIKSADFVPFSAKLDLKPKVAGYDYS